MPRDRWLECRMHGPDGDIEYTVGGSDVSVVFGCSPWKSPLELWREKKGLMKPDDDENADQKEMGHLLEPIVAYWYGRKTGNPVIEDTGLYQHADYPYALANVDYATVDKATGMKGGIECKFTTYRKAGDWSDDALPYYYELQGRFYMAVREWDFVDVACMWGNNPEDDLAIRRVHRDLEIEAMMFERLDEFIYGLRMSIPPTMAGINPDVAMKALAKIYSASKAGLPTIEFGKKSEYALRRIAELQKEKYESDRRTRELEKEVTALSVKIAEAMGIHEHGVLETPDGKLLVEYITKSARRVDSSLLKKDYPDVYDAVAKTTNSRKLKVEINVA
jgi:putative phage-type endonuclease